jgi:hypothetical protein
VWYVEDDTVWPYDPVQNTVTDDCQYAVRHIAEGMERIGLAGRWAYRLADREGACWGLSATQIAELYRSCDALINLEGGTDLRDEHLAAPLRIYLETDPVISQLQLANGDEHTRTAFALHHTIATYGENYGAADCGVPLDGLRYTKTRQAVDLSFWPVRFEPAARFFTTIGNYRQSGNDIGYNGATYHWSKHREWEKFLDLPGRTAQEFELAMMPDDAEDRRRLQAHGWRLRDPFQMSLDIFGAYPAYIQQSREEFTVAKDQNVRLRSGWFSERDVCYLASGKPVIAQDTGFSNIFPTGEGLFAFTNMEQVLAAIDAINSDYPRHCRAARAIAEEYFKAETVAQRLLRDIGLS